jgi:hypothetical protein
LWIKRCVIYVKSTAQAVIVCAAIVRDGLAHPRAWTGFWTELRYSSTLELEASGDAARFVPAAPAARRRSRER